MYLPFCFSLSAFLETANKYGTTGQFLCDKDICSLEFIRSSCHIDPRPVISRQESARNTSKHLNNHCYSPEKKKDHLSFCRACSYCDRAVVDRLTRFDASSGTHWLLPTDDELAVDRSVIKKPRRTIRSSTTTKTLAIKKRGMNTR